MNKQQKLTELRHVVARCALPDTNPPVLLGHGGADAVLGGGLRPGLHEVFAEDWCAGGFAAGLAIRATGNKPLFWVRPDYASWEYGGVSAGGLLELGGDPAKLVLLRASDAAGALSAAADILHCPHVGALLLEIVGTPGCLDPVAGRRLTLAAAQAGLVLILLRAGAAPAPSAALTRWQIQTAPSLPDDDDWGNPRWRAELVRNRLGGVGTFLLQWDCDNGIFRKRPQHAPHHGAVVPAPAHRPAETRIAI